MRASIQQRFSAWARARQTRHEGTVTLTQRSVYIIPTRRGFAFAGALVVMLLGVLAPIAVTVMPSAVLFRERRAGREQQPGKRGHDDRSPLRCDMRHAGFLLLTMPTA